ncbi:DUF4199 domain-containing protein [Deminuibacter soli]|uniref:DUF4199 domain-containing protein n=1 Tax=Deminuibacter soli TaxID=2291815 RepID=A0A3E1NC62_9BACT|nr:DUF4199 domain-containing protein [Deminuibacter soli]RFM25609.1 DUF4199 domain-containing protein [Deminuibacter soli]
METKPVKPAVYGLIISLVLIVFNLVVYFTHQMENRPLGSVSFLILIGGIIYGCIEYAKQNNGNVTFGNVFAHGFKITAVVIVIQALYTVLSIKVLFPDIIDITIDTARKKMIEEGKATPEQIQQGLDMTRKFFMPFAIGGIIIAFGVVGAIASAIGAAVAKKNPQAQNPFQQ